MENGRRILLMTGFQEDFLGNFENRDEFLGKIIKMTEEEDFDHIILAKNQITDESPFYRNMKNCGKSGNIDERIVKLIGEEGKRSLYVMNGYGLLNDELKALLKSDECDGCSDKMTIYLAGLDAEGAVMATAYQLFEEMSLNFKIIKNLCASSDNPTYHKMAVSLMEKSFGPEFFVEYTDHNEEGSYDEEESYDEFSREDYDPDEFIYHDGDEDISYPDEGEWKSMEDTSDDIKNNEYLIDENYITPEKSYNDGDNGASDVIYDETHEGERDAFGYREITTFTRHE